MCTCSKLIFVAWCVYFCLCMCIFIDTKTLSHCSVKGSVFECIDRKSLLLLTWIYLLHGPAAVGMGVSAITSLIEHNLACQVC